MINEEKDTMLVTLTVGQLEERIADAVSAQMLQFQAALFKELEVMDRRMKSDDTVVGSRAIAATIGCNPNTLYKLMRENPKLASAVKKVGTKRIASRAALFAALEN